MIITLISWFIIFIVSLSWGNILIETHSKIANDNTSYGIIDTLILGICCLLIPVSIISIWFPINHLILLILFLTGIVYNIILNNRIRKQFQTIKDACTALTPAEKIAIFIAVLSVLIYVLWPSFTYDSRFYHQQQIRWNEEYSIVPGLGNIEDRFGFNSNYLLISSLFTFRFIFGEAVYALQSCLFTCILIWTLINIFKSEYNIRHIIVLMFMIVAFITEGQGITDTDTDIFPTLCILYIYIKTITQGNWYIKQPLISIFLPLALITFKLSAGIFAISAFLIAICFIRKKDYKLILSPVILSLLIIVPWLVRNIFISGYLVYPLYEIDLFLFDWKVPETTAIMQRLYIKEWANTMHEITLKYPVLIFNDFIFGGGSAYIKNIFTILVFAISTLSPILFVYNGLRKIVKLNDGLYLYYFTSLICILFWYVSARDFRFASGYLLGCSLLTVFLATQLWNRRAVLRMKLKKRLVFILITAMVMISLFKNNQAFKLFIRPNTDLLTKDLYISKLFNIYTDPDIKKNGYYSKMEKYNMGDVVIFLSPHYGYFGDDLLPATYKGGLPFDSFTKDKIQSIETVECRGKTIQDGFRTKKEYQQIMSKDIDNYKKDFERNYLQYKENSKFIYGFKK